jgi:DNA polymerase-3 subunit epsilon
VNNRFIAFDFETAAYQRNSACALGVVAVEKGKVVEQASFLIRPPVNYFVFTHIHGITWDDVKNQPTFGELWPEISRFFCDIDFAVAHNVSFDKSVLNACCGHYGIDLPSVEYRCTLKISRQMLDLERHTLDAVSRHYGIKLNHHEALSDASACAEIMLNFLDRE